jgi:anti-anti-sigma factor
MSEPAGNAPSHKPGCKIEYEPLSSDIFEIKVTGELGMGSVGSLDRVMKNIFDQGIYRVVLNLEGTYYIASSGIGIIVASQKAAAEFGGDLIVAAVNARVKQVFDLVGLQNVVRYASNTKDAVKLFKKK